MHGTVLDPDHAVAEGCEGHEIVRHEILDKGIAFGAESLVTNRKRFIHNQNISVGMCADGKSKARCHAARIEFHRLIKEIADVGESGDIGKPGFDGGAPHPQYGAANQSILAACQLMIKAGTKSKNRRDPAIDFHLAMGWQGNAADDLQQSGFSSAIAANDADPFTAANIEADVPQDPVLMIELFPMPEDRLLELIVAAHIELERLADAITANDKIR